MIGLGSVGTNHLKNVDNPDDMVSRLHRIG